MCLFFMNIKGVFPRELSVTEFALEFVSVIVMYLHMALKITLCCKPLMTDMAVEPLLTSMKYRLNAKPRVK